MAAMHNTLGESTVVVVRLVLAPWRLRHYSDTWRFVEFSAKSDR